jgi:hypothetical protein
MAKQEKIKCCNCSFYKDFYAYRGRGINGKGAREECFSPAKADLEFLKSKGKCIIQGKNVKPRKTACKNFTNSEGTCGECFYRLYDTCDLKRHYVEEDLPCCEWFTMRK